MFGIINYIKPAIMVALFAVPSRAEAQSAKDLQAYDALATFAERICKDAPLSSSSTKTELSANAKAELNEFFKKLVDIGVDAKASKSNTTTFGVTQDSLAASIASSNDCRLSVIREFKDKILKSSTSGLLLRKIGPDGFAIGDPFYKARSIPGATRDIEDGYEVVRVHDAMQIPLQINGAARNVLTLTSFEWHNRDGVIDSFGIFVTTALPCVQNPLLEEMISIAKLDFGDPLAQGTFVARGPRYLGNRTWSTFERNGVRLEHIWGDTNIIPPRSCSIFATTKASQ